MAASTPSSQRIWDAPVRLTHWALLVLVGFSWWSGENRHMDWHRYSGYAVLTLLLFRLYWGLAGSTSARFASFVRGPRAVSAYVRQLRQAASPHPIGHNPLGAWSVLALLALLLTQTGTGLFAVDSDGLESGPMAVWVSFSAGRRFADLHEISFDILLVLVILHVLAIAAYRVFKRQDLLTPMLSGRAVLAPLATAQLNFAGWQRAVAGLLISALMVFLLSRGLRF